MNDQARATTAKERYIESLGGWQSATQYGIVAVGLGRSGDEWHIEVRTKTRSAADNLAREFDGVPVRALYVGEITPL